MAPVTGESKLDGGTVLTVQWPNVWQGTVVLSAASSIAPGGSGAVVYPSVTLESDGIGTLPVPGSIVAEVALATPLVGLFSLVGSASSVGQAFEVTIQTSSNKPATLKLHFNGATGVCAVATGQTISS